MNRDYCNYILLAVLGIMFSTTINAQKKSDPYKPKWVTHKLPESKSGTYIFISSYGEGTSLDAARQKALANLSSRLEIERGLKVSSVLSSKMKETFSSIEKENDYTETTEIDMVIEEHGKELNIVCRVVDEYWEKERKGYKVYVLYTVADKNFHGGSYNDKITVTSKYGANGLLSIIPGAGQFYKGANFKGTAIITTEVIAVAGILLCEETRSSYKKKMIEQPKHAAEYNSRMDTWETARNICIGAATTVYVVNLIDALCTKGAKRVKVENKSNDISLRPFADMNSIGFALTF